MDIVLHNEMVYIIKNYLFPLQLEIFEAAFHFGIGLRLKRKISFSLAKIFMQGEKTLKFFIHQGNCRVFRVEQDYGLR